MNYTKEQLNADLHVVLKDNIPTDDLLDILQWKKWRILESKTVKSGQPDEIVYTVSEIEAVPRDETSLEFILWVLTFGKYDKEFTNSLQWKPYTVISYGMYGSVAVEGRTFKTKEEADSFIQTRIEDCTSSETTHNIIDIQPK